MRGIQSISARAPDGARWLLIALCSGGLFLCALVTGQLFGTVRITPASVAFLALWLMAAGSGCWILWRHPTGPVVLAMSIAAIALRAAILVVTRGAFPAFDDPAVYQHMAVGLASGHGLAGPLGGYSWRALFPPLYPLLLGLSYAALGPHPWVPTAISLLAAFGTALTIIAIGGLLGARRAALPAAFLSFIWPSTVILSAFPAKEPLATLLVMQCVYAWLRLWNGHVRPQLALLYGLLAGLLALTQPALFPLALLLLPCLSFRLPARIVAKIAGVVLAASALVILPWAIRNWLLLGRVIPLTLAGQVNFYTNATLQPLHSITGLGEADTAARMFQLGLRAVAQYPLDFAVRQLREVILAFGRDIAPLLHLGQIHPPPRLAAADLYLVTQIPFLILWCAAFLAAMKRRIPPAFAAIAIAILASLLLANGWFEISERHRAWLVPLFLVMISAAARDLLNREPPRTAS